MYLPNMANLCQLAKFCGKKINNSLSFDASVKRFGHFTQHIEISTFTKEIRNQVKFGHVISIAQNRQ